LFYLLYFSDDDDDFELESSESLDDDELDALLEVDIETKNKEDAANETSTAEEQGTYYERVRVRPIVMMLQCFCIVVLL
jgi:hypothetical protein